jgi:hypothetical protein
VFDPAALPLAAAYLARLPEGLDSYPSCLVRTEVTQLLLEKFPHVLDHPGVAPAFADRLREELGRGEWMSEATGVAVRMVTRDSIFQNDAEYDDWALEMSRELYTRRVYRVLMYLISPSLVILGAARRWNAFRQGTTLVATPHSRGGDIELAFPPHLYTPLVLGGLGQAFRAALEAARARNAKITLGEAQVDRARWSVTWD